MNNCTFFLLALIYLSTISNILSAQQIDFSPPQLGSEVSWCKSQLGYFNRHLDVTKGITNPEIVLINFELGKKISVAGDLKIFGVLVFNNHFIEATIDGRLIGYMNNGTRVQELLMDSKGSVCLSLCKIADEGKFAILSLSSNNEKNDAKYEIKIIEIRDAKFEVVKTFPAVEFGKLIYQFDHIWLIGRKQATQY